MKSPGKGKAFSVRRKGHLFHVDEERKNVFRHDVATFVRLENGRKKHSDFRSVDCSVLLGEREFKSVRANGIDPAFRVKVGCFRDEFDRADVVYKLWDE